IHRAHKLAAAYADPDRDLSTTTPPSRETRMTDPDAAGTTTQDRLEENGATTATEATPSPLMGSSGAQPQMTIKSPGNGSIAVNNAVEGQWVTSGTQLATAYDFNKIYVTARVDETDVADIHPGAQHSR
ncbi:MAG: hypothetical protein JWQ60_671, partial [Pseudonocardia sp.]|nr:hypothetical protein [Pseudonocardia sp.]